MPKKELRVRRSLQDIYNDFKSGKDTATLEKLMVAWQFIKALPAGDPNSFMTLGGFHGEPFAGRGSYDVANYWGGYCNHGNILFPTWHRIYLHKLEKALQSVPGCDSVMLPYWDQTYKITVDGKLTYLGVPPILTDEYFTFSSGATIPNPLKSFTLPMTLQDGAETNFYSKPLGYETVRYPLSGLVGTAPDRAATEVNNSAYYVPGTTIIDNKLTTSLLNTNVIGWLAGTVVVPSGLAPGGAPVPLGQSMGGIDENYHKCLNAPCYTVFSNSVSKARWNKDHPDALAQALESPHGEIHLAVGGINTPFQDANSTTALATHQFWVADANGDMGENETAGLDPIFFFHHCNVDRILWIWQHQHKATDKLDIKVPGWNEKKDGPYPGTNNANNQPPVGYEQTEQLTMDSPLYPFKLVENGTERYYTSADAFNIETQLGFTYDSLSLDNNDGSTITLKAAAAEDKKPAIPDKSNKVLIVDGINRANINGSFVITAFATVQGERYFLGSESVLSRWKVVACRNCMTHLEVSATFSLHRFSEEELSDAFFEININGRKSNDAEFARFTVANQTNLTRFLNAKGTGNFKATAMKAAAEVPAASAKGQSPFSLQVL